MTPPPSTLTYSLMITLICYLICIPMDLAIGKVQEEIGQKEPDFNRYKMRRFRDVINKYLGMCFYDSSSYKVKLPSPLEQLMKPTEPTDSTHRRPGSERVPRSVNHIHDATKDNLELELGYVDAYGDLLSPREELLTMTMAAHLFFQRLYLRSFAVNEIMAPTRVATLKAIQTHLSMNADGTLVSLTWWQRLFFKDRQDMLEKKLTKAKAQASLIVEVVDGVPKSEASSRDVALIQHFMIGNVHSLYRVALAYNMLGFNHLPERVDPILWVLSWCYVVGALIFFLYWTFAWGVKTGPDLLPTWGLYFGLNMIQDIFFTQIVKIIILKVRVCALPGRRIHARYSPSPLRRTTWPGPRDDRLAPAAACHPPHHRRRLDDRAAARTRRARHAPRAGAWPIHSPHHPSYLPCASCRCIASIYPSHLICFSRTYTRIGSPG